jgi:hypothetical protein
LQTVVLKVFMVATALQLPAALGVLVELEMAVVMAAQAERHGLVAASQVAVVVAELVATLVLAGMAEVLVVVLVEMDLAVAAVVVVAAL